MTTTDTRTDAERRYDAERDGSLYVKGDLITACLDYVDQLERDERISLAQEADRVLSDGNDDEEEIIKLTVQALATMDADEAAVVDWILRETAPVIATDPDADGRLVATDSTRPVVVKRWEGSGSVWLNFELGQAQVGVYISPDEKPGLEVDIYGTPLNEGIKEIITLADLRQLHTDLGAILADERLLGALAEQEEHPAA